MKNFFQEYEKYMHFLKKPYPGKLDNTNNQTENYVGNTMPRAHKKKFRTLKESIQSNNTSKNGWIEKRKQGLTF